MSNHSKDTAQMLIDEAYSKALKAMHKIDCIAYFDGPHRVDDLDRVADDYHSYAMCILDAIQDLHRSGGAQNIMRPVSRHLGALMKAVRLYAQGHYPESYRSMDRIEDVKRICFDHAEGWMPECLILWCTRWKMMN